VLKYRLKSVMDDREGTLNLLLHMLKSYCFSYLVLLDVHMFGC
jgi:hypothetical protein